MKRFLGRLFPGRGKATTSSKPSSEEKNGEKNSIFGNKNRQSDQDETGENNSKESFPAKTAAEPVGKTSEESSNVSPFASPPPSAREFRKLDNPMGNMQAIFDQITCFDFPFKLDDSEYIDSDDVIAVPYPERKAEIVGKAARYLREMFDQYQDRTDFARFQYVLAFCLGTLLLKLEQYYERNDIMLQMTSILNEQPEMDRAEAVSNIGNELMITLAKAAEEAEVDEAEIDAIEELPLPSDDPSPILKVRFVDMRKIKSTDDVEDALVVCDENKYLVEISFPRTLYPPIGKSSSSLSSPTDYIRGVSPKTIRRCIKEQQNAALRETSILSWRWDIQKPLTLEEARSLRSRLVREYLLREMRRGTKLVWVDWMCVKQYGGFNIEELRDTNRFYAVLPPAIFPKSSGTAYAPSNIYKYTQLSLEYSSRAWTAAEHAKLMNNPRNKIGELIPLDPPETASIREKRRFELTAHFGIYLSGLSLPRMHRVDRFLYRDEPLMVGEILDLLYATAMRSARPVPEDVQRDKERGRVMMSSTLRQPFFEDWTEVELGPSLLRTGMNVQVSRRVYAIRDAISQEERLKKITWKEILPWVAAHDDLMKTVEGPEDKAVKERTLVPPKELGKTPKQVMDSAPCDKRLLFFIVRLTEAMGLFVKLTGDSLTAGAFRIFLMPVDTLKTILQVEGKNGLPILREKISKGGIRVIYHGALGAAGATAGFSVYLCI